MPNAVAQNRKTTVAAETRAGRSAGRVTSRSTCHGPAPRAAAASAGRGSSDSQAPPTTRITTEALKKTSPATIAAGVPSRPRKPSGPVRPMSCSNATPTTTVGSTNGHDEEGAEGGPAGEVEAVEDVGRGQAEDERERRTGGRRPEREPDRSSDLRPPEHHHYGAEVEVAVDEQPATEHPPDGQHEEHP